MLLNFMKAAPLDVSTTSDRPGSSPLAVYSSQDSIDLRYTPFDVSPADLKAMSFPRRIPDLTEEDLLETMKVISEFIDKAADTSGDLPTHEDIYSYNQAIPEPVRSAAETANSLQLDQLRKISALNLNHLAPFLNPYSSIVMPMYTDIYGAITNMSHSHTPHYTQEKLFIHPEEEHTSLQIRLLAHLQDRAIMMSWFSNLFNFLLVLNTAKYAQYGWHIRLPLAIALTTPSPDWETVPVEEHLYAMYKFFAEYVESMVGKNYTSLYGSMPNYFQTNRFNALMGVIGEACVPRNRLTTLFYNINHGVFPIGYYLPSIGSEMQSFLEKKAVMSERIASVGDPDKQLVHFLDSTNYENLHSYKRLAQSSSWPDTCISLDTWCKGVHVPAFLGRDSLGFFCLLVPADKRCADLLSKAYGLPKIDVLQQHTILTQAMMNVQSEDFTIAVVETVEDIAYAGMVNIEDYINKSADDNFDEQADMDGRKVFYKFIDKKDRR